MVNLGARKRNQKGFLVGAASWGVGVGGSPCGDFSGYSTCAKYVESPSAGWSPKMGFPFTFCVSLNKLLNLSAFPPLQNGNANNHISPQD